MANLSITITNSVRTFGPAPADYWNAYNWNAFLWGEGTAAMVGNALKVVTNSQTLTELTTPQGTFNLSISNSLSFSEAYAQYSADGRWSRIFSDNVTNAENRAFPTWVSGTAGFAAWTTATVGAPTWS